MKDIIKLASTKDGMKVEICFDRYLWIGEDWNPNVLIVDSPAKLLKIRKAIDRILARQKKIRRVK